MSKPIMGDLKEAIENVLLHSMPSKYNLSGEPVTYEVGIAELRILQAEFNIHFCEPEDEQLELV